MKTTIRNYRGYAITSFNLSQLEDSEISGRSYSVYASEAAYRSGEDALSSAECLTRLSEAKVFVDELVKKEVAS